MKIHREGFKIILIAALLLLAINLGLQYLHLPYWLDISLKILSLAFFIIVLQFFRDPQFQVEKKENAILAPADGKVVVIETVEETEYLHQKCIQLSIFMSPLNVHVNRNPVEGIVTYDQYHPGKYLVAWHPKSSTENERTTFVIKAKNGKEILFRQIAGALAKRIKWYIKKGQIVQQGKEMGFITFGSRIDIFIPTDALVQVQIGDKVKGGKTVLAKFI
jgi:phosphatidylserine decarboxylase